MNATTTRQMIIIIRLRTWNLFWKNSLKSCLTFVEWDSPSIPPIGEMLFSVWQSNSLVSVE